MFGLRSADSLVPLYSVSLFVSYPILCSDVTDDTVSLGGSLTRPGRLPTDEGTTTRRSLPEGPFCEGPLQVSSVVTLP